MKFYTVLHRGHAWVGAELDGALMRLPFADMLDPADFGCFRGPKIFLQRVDVCDLEISGIGTLTSHVKASPYTFPS